MTEKQIIEKEIKHLDQKWKDAQDRYAYNGSRSTDNTMYKYSVLRDALEKSLAGPSDEEQRLLEKVEYLRGIVHCCQQYVKQLEKDGEILPGYAGKIRMILEGRDRYV